MLFSGCVVTFLGQKADRPTKPKTSLAPVSRLRCRVLLGGPHGDNSIDPKRPVALCLHGIGALDSLRWGGICRGPFLTLKQC